MRTSSTEATVWVLIKRRSRAEAIQQQRADSVLELLLVTDGRLQSRETYRSSGELITAAKRKYEELTAKGWRPPVVHPWPRHLQESLRDLSALLQAQGVSTWHDAIVALQRIREGGTFPDDLVEGQIRALISLEAMRELRSHHPRVPGLDAIELKRRKAVWDETVAAAFRAYGEPQLADEFLHNRGRFVILRDVASTHGLVYPFDDLCLTFEEEIESDTEGGK
jgi:hypothetical protein